jgi:catalase
MATDDKSNEHQSPAQLNATLRSVFGIHRARTVHAKGVLMNGAFMPTVEARSLCAATLFQGAIEHILVRFSDFGGIPDIPDTDPNANPRGFAVKFCLPDGSFTDAIGHSFNGFPTATSDEFAVLIGAIAASGPDAAKPTALDKFLASHPRAAEFLTKQKPAPVSWATLTYFGVNSFRFIDAAGKGTFVRYRFVPQAGEQLLDAKGIAARGPNYLAEEIAARVGQGPIMFDWLAQLAQPSDIIDDPSIAWPEDRKLVKLGSISIVRVTFDQELNDRSTVFAPGNLPKGIEPADPMVAVRDATYAISYRERQ